MELTEGTAPERLRTLPSRLINMAALSANRLVDRVLADEGVRRYHYALLAALEEFGPASQAALGRRTGIDRSDVVAAINELAERALVERSPDPADRRRNIVSITAEGSRRLATLDRLLAAAQDELLGPLSDAERRQLVDLLTRVVERQSAGDQARLMG
ncbi:DNA-binding MarR family transcriptional regulator [Thermocatellispora tengchongensis]|uniref:DNA-binding MarR family transcriptional regulator n=1 Tax=Thermocatellispora tengchongensis TaxID=1073253 RepID=A0A840PQ92_9ACTN|nr:MarR family transcriptional regulator [Thermocatellispora tengchongensis]MBB5139941.1 DNA-binding MarR family transcriptional regulator [Thermocatellispora tengchongensis]